MSGPTFVLRHYHDDCASNNLSLATMIEGMEANSMSSLYSDFRSPSRGQRQHLRKQQRILNPMFRTKHCHRDCLSYAHRAISSRQRRQEVTRAECTDEAYWDEECAEREHGERTGCSDLVTLFYNHGHNAEAIKSLRPKLPNDLYEDEDEDEWVHVSDDRIAKRETKVVKTKDWTLCLYLPSPFPTCNSSSLDTKHPNADPFTHPHNWDETTFTYHRNLTGLWELGYGPDYTLYAPDPYGCAQTPLALDCACCASNRGFFACSCSAFPAQWRSPQEDWRGSLVAWMGEQLDDDLRCADALYEERRRFDCILRDAMAGSDSRGGREKAGKGRSGEWTFVRALSAERAVEEWDIVSTLSSTGSWRVVDVT